MNRTRALVLLDRGTRFLNRLGLGKVRHRARDLLGSTVARHLSVEVDGLVVTGTIQQRDYLRQLRDGTVEPYTARLLADAVGPGTTFLDVGAYLGIYAMTAARRGANVVAFEANPENRALLVANITRNQLADQITVHPFAVSDEAGEVPFFIGSGNQSSSGLTAADSNTTAVSVDACRLDDVVADADVVKIDIEGAEVKALRGMTRLLGSTRPMTMVLECNPDGLADFGSSSEDLVALLVREGFRVWQISERDHELVEVQDAPVVRSGVM